MTQYHTQFYFSPSNNTFPPQRPLCKDPGMLMSHKTGTGPHSVWCCYLLAQIQSTLDFREQQRAMLLFHSCLMFLERNKVDQLKMVQIFVLLLSLLLHLIPTSQISIYCFSNQRLNFPEDMVLGREQELFCCSKRHQSTFWRWGDETWKSRIESDWPHRKESILEDALR